jgi:hypothetical protein
VPQIGCVVFRQTCRTFSRGTSSPEMYIGWYSEFPHSTATSFILPPKRGLRTRSRIESPGSFLPCLEFNPTSSHLTNAPRMASVVPSGFGSLPFKLAVAPQPPEAATVLCPPDPCALTSALGTTGTNKTKASRVPLQGLFMLPLPLASSSSVDEPRTVSPDSKSLAPRSIRPSTTCRKTRTVSQSKSLGHAYSS